MSFLVFGSCYGPSGARSCLIILFDPQLPGGLQRFGQLSLAGDGKTNVCRSHSSPAAGNWQENIWSAKNERLLQLGCQHQIAKFQFLHGERRKDSTADAEIGLAHVRTLFGSFETQRNLAKIIDVHRRSRCSGRLYHGAQFCSYSRSRIRKNSRLFCDPLKSHDFSYEHNRAR